MCLASTMVASLSLTQEVSGLNSLMKNIFEVVLANSVKTFRVKSNEKKRNLESGLQISDIADRGSKKRAIQKQDTLFEVSTALMNCYQQFCQNPFAHLMFIHYILSFMPSTMLSGTVSEALDN